MSAEVFVIRRREVHASFAVHNAVYASELARVEIASLNYITNGKHALHTLY